MDRERRIELLEGCSLDRLLGLGLRLEQRCRDLLDTRYRPESGRLSGEQRKYLAAFEAWVKNPTEENYKIKRAALFAMRNASV